ncbi:ABC-F family ATP-binding cassette domain-containing protein [Bacillus sp. AFS041924]|uniref:ABC-F family ATP-binding cassette domain-containing protein n=1 Tax=Bacillus sp. AFS041924 TaxID=2033503 RepID=UPI000BFDC8F0|nr:ABC-F family ATP-binding cassette domain-containing protein [Bacillus sp. AFS041924]PGS46994.1 multidrug ABC transporter ATP-binding protein [Bacillus sp. AFS041924]
MKILSVENLIKTYGEKTLFDKISFTVSEGQKIGLLGINGTGKSSLLKIIAGVETADEGKITTPKDYVISYLPQHEDFDKNQTILEAVFESEDKVMVLVKTYEKTLQALGEDPTNQVLQNELLKLQADMDTLNGWDLEANAKTILSKLGLSNLNIDVSILSGGQKKRVALAKALIHPCDLLILDEPTNHLDYECIVFLQEYIKRLQNAVLFVTHDRYFLDEVTTALLELSNSNIYRYEGNYQYYIEQRAAREEQDAATNEKRNNLFRRELAWMRRGAKARTTKQKARIQRFEDLSVKINNQEKAEMEMNFQQTRLGKKVVEFINVDKSFDEKTILDNFNLLLLQTDRIGIIGENGAGKTTLLKMLVGEEQVDSGEIEIGQTVKVAYYTQIQENMNPTMRMIDYIKEEAEVIHTPDGKTISASQMLETFLFPTHSHGVQLGKLSGGEKRRLYLLRLLMTAPNLLLLDEPTNDLDIDTLTVLEDYIENFSGVVVTVSHDRYFLDKVTNKLLIFEGKGKVSSTLESYTEYLERQSIEKREVEIEKVAVEKPVYQKEQKKKRLTYQEQKEWDSIESDIEKLDNEIEQLNEKLQAVGSNFDEAYKLSKEIEEKESLLEQKMERWSVLSDLVESLK